MRATASCARASKKISAEANNFCLSKKRGGVGHEGNNGTASARASDDRRIDGWLPNRPAKSQRSPHRRIETAQRVRDALGIRSTRQYDIGKICERVFREG